MLLGCFSRLPMSGSGGVVLLACLLGAAAGLSAFGT